jgi:predicted nucleic-acid-binding protein
VIALDSNILVRYFQRDDLAQSIAADRILDVRSPQDPGWIAIPVVIELLWVLTRSYRLRQPAIIEILERLLSSDDLVLEQGDRIRRALDLYAKGRADFADCLIAVSAKDVGCSRILSFDEKAARDAGMELALT